MKSVEGILSLMLVSSRSRATLAALAMTVVVAAGALWSVWPIARVFETAIVADNPGWYLEMAANLSWCHRYPFVTSTLPVNQEKVNLTHLSLERVGAKSLRSLAVSGVGSIADYCALNGTKMALPEASIVMIESVLLTLNRRITVAGIGSGLAWFAAAEFAVFALALVKLRWPMLFAGACASAGLYLTALLGSTALYTQYRLMLPTLLLGIGLGVLGLMGNVQRRLSALLPTAAAMGVWISFTGNVRTSLYPAAILIGVLFVGACVLDLRRVGAPRRRVAMVAGAGAAAMLAGWLAFDLSYISPQRANEGYSYHVIAHPLVLGLAVPPNALAAREHIEWLDEIGLVAARKVDPAVAYLGPGYERALYIYYFRLWRNNFREMISIYAEKLRQARLSAEKFFAREEQGQYWFVKDGRWLTLAAWPAMRIASVVGVTGLFLLLLGAGLFRPRWLGVDIARGFCLTSVAVAGLFGFAESSVIMSSVVLQYSAVYLFALVFAGLFLYQSTIDIGWRTWSLPRGDETVNRG
jgi:hypothetical protein